MRADFMKGNEKSVVIKSLIFLVMALSSALSVTALTQVASGYYYSGDTLTIDRQIITVYLSSKNGIVAEYGNSIMFVSNNSCQSSDYFKLCLDNIQFDYTARKDKMTLRAFSNGPVITMTRTASKSELALGEEALVSVSISNSGGIARNGTFRDDFPEGFEVYDADGASIVGNSVVWNGEIGTSGEKELNYRIKPKIILKETLKSSFKYFDGYAMQSVYSSATTFNVNHFLGMEVKLGHASVYVSQPNNLTINFTNRGNETANITLVLSFPSGYQVTAPHSVVNIGNNSFRWSDTLRKRNLSNNKYFSKALTFDFKTANIGSAEIFAYASYIGSEPVKVELPDLKRTVDVSDRGIAVRANLNDRLIESNQKFTVKAWVQNLNGYSPIQEVYATTYSDFGYIPDSYFKSMASSRSEPVLEKDFFAPNVTQTTGYKLELNVSYNISGKHYIKTFKDSLSIIPAKNLVISSSPTKSSVESGGELFFAVSVNNPRLTRVNRVLVYDDIPPNFSVSGYRSALVSISKGSSATAYTYKLVAPKVKTQSIFSINTTVEYSDADSENVFSVPSKYRISKETKITVDPVAFSLSATSTLVESSFYTGHIHSADYVISNPTEYPARDVTLFFQPQHQFDIVGPVNVSIPDIDPGETVYVTSKHRFRPKYNGSQVLLKSYLVYRNDEGQEYRSNLSDVSLSVKTGVIQGPMLVVNMTAPDEGNLTEMLPVTVLLNNIGNEGVVANIDNGLSTFSAYVASGSVFYYNYSLSMPDIGTFGIPVAKVSYSYNGKSYLTGTNPRKVNIVDKPLVSIEKSLPSVSSTVDEIEVELKVKSFLLDPLDITVVDESFEWVISNFSNETVLRRNITFDRPGTTKLEPANVSYAYQNKSYNVSSNSPSVEVSEKSLLSVNKSASKGNVVIGEEITVTISVKNLHEKSLSVELVDNGKEWTLELEPGDEKEVSYMLKVKDNMLEPAAASVSYKGRLFTVTSSSVSLEIPGKEVQEVKASSSNITLVKEPQEDEEGGIIKKILNAISNILSFRKSDI